MGEIIGAVGSLVAGNQAHQDAKKAAQQALTGYNYDTTGAGAPSITQAQTAGSSASQAQAGTQGAESQLLGTAPVTDQTKNGFQNYLNSTGYQFQLGQGQQAVAGSAAAKGILNSGSTAKALTQYGQNLATGSFNNYLGQLGSLNNQQGATAAQGLQATGIVSNAGTGGGGAAANATTQGADTFANGIGTAAGSLAGSSAVANAGKSISNWFGGL